MREILKSIETGQLKPGDKLPTERELSKMFGVGRSTLREATSALTLLGCLQVIQGKGTFLKKNYRLGRSSDLEFSDIQAAAHIIDLMELRTILECNAVKLTAQRANASDIDRIQTAVAEMKQSVDDIVSFTRQDLDFHVALALATGNDILHEMTKRIVKRAHNEYDSFKSQALFDLPKAVETAERILSHVISGDGEKAAASMLEHLQLVTGELERLLPDATVIKGKRLL
jgi:GntR family transcriptional repressor for pyruvate dehydrogenase complex